ncbi:MAG: AAA family ATPase [Clostridia bacterium]|nr:AAA family ATPase [Clostridia bacterium]
MPGRILFLHGLTSSGKSSAAHCLARLCPTPLFLSSNDVFHDMIAGRFFQQDFWREVARTIGAQYAAVRGMADAGFDTVIDGMGLDLPEYEELFGRRHADLVREWFRGLDVTFIRFDCPLDELRRRNLVRGDRGEFQSEDQAKRADPAFPADLVIDMMTTFPDEAARRILAFAGIPAEEAGFADEADDFRARVLAGFLGEWADVFPACSEDDGLRKTAPDGGWPVEVDAVLRDPGSADIVAVELTRRGYREVGAHGVRLFLRGERDVCRMLDAPPQKLAGYLGKTVSVTIDRPAGTRHPEHPDLVYPIPYGDLCGTLAPDGEPIDAYCPGFENAGILTGMVSAVIRRDDDAEEKLIVTPPGVSFSAADLWDAVRFTERYFRSTLIQKKP